ncbi:hypothetical protein LguiB_027663 [Lonicera macranthoides]
MVNIYVSSLIDENWCWNNEAMGLSNLVDGGKHGKASSTFMMGSGGRSNSSRVFYGDHGAKSVRRSGNYRLKKCIDFVKNREAKIRDYYLEPIQMDTG